MSATPLHRESDSRVPFVVAIISGMAATVMAVLAMSLNTLGL